MYMCSGSSAKLKRSMLRAAKNHIAIWPGYSQIASGCSLSRTERYQKSRKKRDRPSTEVNGRVIFASLGAVRCQSGFWTILPMC